MGVTKAKKEKIDIRLQKKRQMQGGNSMGTIYMCGFIGAMIYYMQAAHSFMEVVTGTLHAFAWPAYIVYKLFESYYGIVH